MNSDHFDVLKRVFAEAGLLRASEEPPHAPPRALSVLGHAPDRDVQLWFVFDDEEGEGKLSFIEVS